LQFAVVRMVLNHSNDSDAWLVNLPPTSRQNWWAFTGATGLLLGFLVLAPFAATPLPQLNGFIPATDATICVTDFITATLLFAQFSISHLRALLALACGYLFTALIVIAHALSFPGAFSPTGNLGGSLQTTLRIYIFWHLGAPVALLAYTWLKDEKRSKTTTQVSAPAAIGWCVAGVSGAVCGLVWLAAAGDKVLPSFFVDPTQHSPVAPWVAPLAMLICAIAMIVLWARQRSVLDLWLLIVALASIVELALTALLGAQRFTLGFYTGRIFSLVTSNGVLVVLLAEMTRLYGRLARSNILLQRERGNKLMSFEAIANTIAHEIRQPLATIAANGGAALGFLEKEQFDRQELQTILNDIVEDSHRTSELLDGVQSLYQRIDQGRQPIDMNGLALDVLQTIRSELMEHGITANPELKSELPLIAGNRNQLHQVVFNLVHNAVEAMASTSAQSRVLRLLTERRGRDAIALAVQDSGPGIDPKRLEEIFDAFVTTKAHGMGLGLAICRTIVERHGGRLTATSDGRTGALFEVILPLVSKDEAAAPVK
jgi:signal transduction histidine kinase